MKKLITLMLLFMGSITGVYAQTFDFSCADSEPDQMGTNWELYIGDRLVIDNIVWPFTPEYLGEHINAYLAPDEWEYDRDIIQGLRISQNPSTKIWAPTFTGILAEVEPQTTLQLAIDFVRDIPYVATTFELNPTFETSSYRVLTNVLNIDTRSFIPKPGRGSISFDSPVGWANQVIEIDFTSGEGWKIDNGTGTNFEAFVVALRLLKTVVLPILTHSDGYSYNPNTLVLTANGRDYTSQGTDQVQRYHLNDDWPENLSVEHYQNQENDSWGILQNGVQATYHATFNAMVAVLIPRLIVRQPILGTGGNTWNPNNGTLTINGNTVARGGFESGSPFYNLPPNYSDARGFIRILRRTNGNWDLNNLEPFNGGLGSYGTFDEMIVGLLRASGRRFEHMNAWYNSTVEINPDDPNERGTFRVGDVYFLRTRSGGDQTIFTAPDGWAVQSNLRFIARDDGRFVVAYTNGSDSGGQDYDDAVALLLANRTTISRGVNNYDAANNTFTYDGIVWSRRGNTFESPSSQFSTRVIVEPLADGRWKRITQNQIGFFDTFAILVVDLDFRRTN